MPYYLKHYFDPYFDFCNIRPRENKSGRVDHYNMGYVQNVVAGQPIAEWEEINEEEAKDRDPSFVSETPEFHPGPNTGINPQDSHQLVAAANGYVFYHEGRIAVKKVLNVRGDVDFHTGNIYFVGDMIVHGRVRSGFEIQAVNIRVHDIVEGGRIKAGKSLVLDSGIKGRGEAMAQAGENLRTAFCEKATLRACTKLIIDGVSMHSDLLSRNFILVKDRLIGGHVYSSKLVYVKRQLGGGMSTRTSLTLGYDSRILYEMDKVKSNLSSLRSSSERLERKSARGGEYTREYGPLVEKQNKKIGVLEKRLERLSSDLEKSLNLQAKVIVPGEIRPGVVIRIGTAELKIDDYMQDVRFYYHQGEIKYKSPAEVRK